MQQEHKGSRPGLPGASWIVTISLVLFVICDQPFVRLLLGPCDILATFLHEMGHVIACLLTGGTVQSITILPNNELAGWTNCTGGDPFYIGQAGYLGATFASCLLIIVSRFWRMSNVILLLIGFLTGYCAPKFMLDQPSILASMFLTAAFVIFAFQTSARDARLIVLFVALNVAFHSLLDLRALTILSLGFNSVPAQCSDATAVAAVSSFSAKFWSSLWAVLSLFMLGFTAVLAYCMQHPHEEQLSTPLTATLPLIAKMRARFGIAPKRTDQKEVQAFLAKMQASIISIKPINKEEIKATTRDDSN